jgi:hypothetical protein
VEEDELLCVAEPALGSAEGCVDKEVVFLWVEEAIKEALSKS